MNLTKPDSFLFENLTFVGNKAILGGALCIVDLVVSGNITNCHFNKNIAQKDNVIPGFGGAVYLQQSPLETISSRLLLAIRHQQAQNLLIKNSIFAENIAHAGGAIYAKQFEFILSNDTFLNNQATNGGGLATEITNTASKNHTIIIDKSRFLSNDADLYGASILQLRDQVISLDNDTEITNGNQTYSRGAPAKIGLTAYRYTGETKNDSKRDIKTLLAQGVLTLVYNSSAVNATLNMTDISSGGSFNLLLEFGVYDSENNLLTELGSGDGK